MKYIYYCAGCDYVGSLEEKNSALCCPKCGKRLLPTGLDRELWAASTSEEKAAYKARWTTDAETVQRYPAGEAAQPGGEHANGVAAALRFIAWATYIGAFLLGVFLGRDLYCDFSLTLASIYWVAGFVSGTMFLGFSEIIQLLQDIKNK